MAHFWHLAPPVLLMFTVLLLKHAYWVRTVFGVDDYRFNMYELNLNDLVTFSMSFHHGIIYDVLCMSHTLMFFTVPDWFPQVRTYIIWYASMCLDFELSDAQYGHAVAIEHLVPSLSYLRTELCSTNMSEACFWKIYFVLLHSKLNKQDAEILSTPQVYSFPLFYFLSICGIFLS